RDSPSCRNAQVYKARTAEKSQYHNALFAMARRVRARVPSIGLGIAADPSSAMPRYLCVCRTPARDVLSQPKMGGPGNTAGKARAAAASASGRSSWEQTRARQRI